MAQSISENYAATFFFLLSGQEVFGVGHGQ